MFLNTLLLPGRQLDRTGSMKGEDFSPQNYAKVRGKKVGQCFYLSVKCSRGNVISLINEDAFVLLLKTISDAINMALFQSDVLGLRSEIRR